MQPSFDSDSNLTLANKLKRQKILHQRLKISSVQRKQQKKKIFGQHYNYDVIRLNMQKKFMKQQQRNTEIQRANRILLEKIQNICKRSKRKRIQYSQSSEPSVTRKRYSTESGPTLPRINMDISLKQSPTNESKTRAILFKGKKVIDGQMQNFLYRISVQRDKYEDLIQLPINEYKTILRQALHGNHRNMLNYLYLNKSNAIELKPFLNIQTQIAQICEVKLPQVVQHDS